MSQLNLNYIELTLKIQLYIVYLFFLYNEVKLTRKANLILKAAEMYDFCLPILLMTNTYAYLYAFLSTLTAFIIILVN